MKRALVVALASCLALTGCSKFQVVDFAMSSARRLPRERRAVGPYQVLAGDMHCHVRPPDAAYHVSRELTDTYRLALEEGLDFVVLTPHVPSRFFLDPEQREWVRATQQVLGAKIAQLSQPTGPLLLPGMEYTDYRYGHLGLSFGDVDAVLDEVPLASLERRPELFFEAWQAKGGLATINHPFLEPLPRAPIAELHYDLTWRGFSSAPVPSEIAWLTRHANAIETWNESIGHVRDRWFAGDPDWELRQATHLVQRLARAEQRRVTPVGGSDSHGGWLRPTTWVLATERTPAAIRAGLVAGRTCVRSPDACTLEVRGAGGAFHAAGAAITSARGAVEARSHGGEATYFVNGAVAATAEDGATTRLSVPGTCALVHVRVNDGVSAPVYVDCGWAETNQANSLNKPNQTNMGPPFSSARW
ncbi:MAG: CehA/McbA family metallohydrolase [Labilithrix sp.]|nr:CehA/McbA family metallohydrolase [Labilithrix sp.]MCW5809577.1 CehA/McbA family metallohydrolase [Labilithrix sp.]